MGPARFREELKRFDKTLDIEFNGPEGRWEIVGYDLKNVRYLIKKVPLGMINTLGVETLKELYECSPTKQGGAKELNRKIDALIEAEDIAEERAQQASIQDKLDDAWVHLQYKNGYRVSLATPEMKETVLITDKRRFTPEGDLKEAS